MVSITCPLFWRRGHRAAIVLTMAVISSMVHGLKSIMA